MAKDAHEREIEQAIVDHVSRFKLHCYVVIEIKAGKFKPDHLGQLGFCMTAVDAQVKVDMDGPTIGLLLCKTKNEVVAEYALRDITRPFGIAGYQLLETLPEPLQSNLPSIEQIESEFAGRRALSRPDGQSGQ